jgi:4-hydroxy-3-polyprenylbenzoate decarboxylase
MYANPRTLDEMVDHSLGRVLDLFGIDTGRVMRWTTESRRRGGRPRKS